MPESHLRIIIISVPNGAGKSTTVPSLLQGALGVKKFVNADVIAQDGLRRNGADAPF